MAGPPVDRPVRPGRRAADRLRRQPRVRRPRRLLRRAGARLQPVLGGVRPDRFARHEPVGHDDRGAVRGHGRPARRRRRQRTPQLDAGLLGRHGAGGAGQGPDRPGAAGRGAGAVLGAGGDLAIWKRLHLGKGLLLLFAVATQWFVLVALRNPEQPYFFFVHEHWERFFLKTHHREGAWYYFFVMLIPGIVPWLGLLPQALWGAVRRERNGVFQPKLLLLIWAVFIFFFFSYSSSKLPGYILPIFPALALLIAVDLENASSRSRMIAAGLLVLIGAAGVAAVPQMVTMAVRHPEETALLEAYQPLVLMAGIVAAAGGALALLHARQLWRDL